MAFSPEQAFEFLQRARSNGRLAHAYLITGEPGSGKRRLALRLAAFLNGIEPEAIEERGGNIPDLHTVEPESKSRVIRVEQTRELEKALQMRSSQGGGVKVGILFDAERMNEAAANSFLKTLEEPPHGSILLLLTAHPEMLLDTILSRCIQMPLAAPAQRGPTPGQARLLAELEKFATQTTSRSAGLGEVFGLVRTFTELLGEAKAAVVKEGEDEVKREEALYKQTTDGEWLKEREDYFKALSEARYRREREIFVETLIQWWGDVLRLQHGSDALDFPDQRAITGKLAQHYDTRDVLRRVEALEALRENFNRTVQEQLAIEVAFLGAFGAPAAA